MRTSQILCDECGKALAGQVGTAQVKTDYLTVKGRITLHQYNEQTKQHDYIHATKDAFEENMFCTVDCMEEFVHRRVREHKEAPGKARLDRALKDFHFPSSRPSY